MARFRVIDKYGRRHFEARSAAGLFRAMMQSEVDKPGAFVFPVSIEILEPEPPEPDDWDRTPPHTQALSRPYPTPVRRKK